MRRRFRNENGETVVEATFVVPIVLMIIFILMYLGFILYQQTLIRVVANDTATSIGQVYSTPSKDPFLGFTETTSLSKTKLYRNLYNAAGNLFDSNNTVDAKNMEKADWYARYRLISNRLYKEKGNIGVNVKFERKQGTALQKVVVVKVEATYDLPFLKFFGIMNNTVHFSAVGRAECHDLLDYASTLSLVNTIVSDTVSPLAGAANNGIADVIAKINEIKDKFF